MPWSSCITSVGKELPGFSTMIFKPDEDGHGEVIGSFIINTTILA